MTLAVGFVLALALVLTVAVVYAPSLSDRIRWVLLLLALGAGFLATLRWQGAL